MASRIMRCSGASYRYRSVIPCPPLSSWCLRHCTTGNATSEAIKAPRKRRGFFRRLSRKFLLFGVAIGTFSVVMDADFITYFSDIYRTKYDPKGMRNKCVWVIGASSGIGEYTVYELLKSGASKIILSSRRGDQLERVKRECEQILSQPEHGDLDCELVVVPLDMMDFVDSKDAADKFVHALMGELGSMFIPESASGGLFLETVDIDIVVINSGRTQRSLAIDNEPSVLLQLQQLNVFAPVAMAQAMCRYWRDNVNAGKTLRKSKKLHQIAITSSLAGIVGGPKQSAYAMSKAGLNRYMEAMRLELVNEKVDVNIVCPGPIEVTPESHASFGSAPDAELVSRSEGRMTSMPLTRCASLYVTALQYSLTESWMSPNPALLLSYFRQYTPALLGPLGRIIGPTYTNSEMRGRVIDPEQQS